MKKWMIITLLLFFFLSSFSSAKFSIFNDFDLEKPITELNFFPTKSANIINSSVNGVLSYGGSRIVERKFKFPNFFDPNGASVDELGHHAGYYQIENSHDARMFYFFFESRSHNSKEDPVVIWLTGGPGCSSELALFYENGPFQIANNLSLVWNEHGWDQAANVTYGMMRVGLAKICMTFYS